nr:RNA-directed DNA polymerase, eukaryota [Tanacetum cinerariifolium]
MSTSWTTDPQAPPTKTTSNPNPKHTNTPTNKAIEGQQDGVQEEKGEGEAEEKRKQTCHKKVVNFFITHFPWLQPWTSELKTEDRITWLRIEGLPIHVWCSEAFSQIASVWGTVLIPDECETNDPNFVYGKVCILTREMHHLNKVIDIKVDGLVTKSDSLFGFKKPHKVIKDDLIFDDSAPIWVDDHGNDVVEETKPVDGSLEGTPVASIEIPVKRIIDSEKRGVHGNTTKRVCSERDGTMNTCAGSYASPLGADCSLSESRTSDTTSKIQIKEKVVVDTCDSLSSFDLNLCCAGPINIPSKLDAKIFKNQTSSSPMKEELKDISPKLRSSKALEVLRHLAL